MYDYPHFDGTQACQEPSPAAASAFSGTIGADPEDSFRDPCYSRTAQGMAWQTVCQHLKVGGRQRTA